MSPADIESLLKSAYKRRQDATGYYHDAIEAAVYAGWSNVKIGKTIGLTEAAIRMYRKRNGL